MDPVDYFKKPLLPDHRNYEALKAFYCDGLGSAETAEKYGLSPAYFKKLRHLFLQNLKKGINPFFSKKKPGPKKRSTSDQTIELIVALRKRNYSITDIKVLLDSKGKAVSLDTIDKVLKSEGFAPLPKRTRMERLAVSVPEKNRGAEKRVARTDRRKVHNGTRRRSPRFFTPHGKTRLGGGDQKRRISPYVRTRRPSKRSFFSGLETAGRPPMVPRYEMEHGQGLSGCLPDSTSCRNRLLFQPIPTAYQGRRTKGSLSALSRIFRDDELENGEFNLDFKAIPHWGDASVLEKNWAGSRSKAMKSLLALVAQDPSTGNLSYANAEVKHRNQSDAVFDFVDFWKQGRGVAPKMLIFDSKFTTYKNLSELNQSEEKIKFLTIRRRSKSLIEKAEKIESDHWRKISVERSKGKYQKIRIYEEHCKLRHYKGEVRQIVMTDHGRRKPTFLITNDFDADAGKLVKKICRPMAGGTGNCRACGVFQPEQSFLFNCCQGGF